MAVLTLQELRELLGRHREWEAEGFEPPERQIAIELKQGDGEQQVLEPELANKTLTYAGREVTLVLDFDVNPRTRALAFAVRNTLTEKNRCSKAFRNLWTQFASTHRPGTLKSRNGLGASPKATQPCFLRSIVKV